MIRLRHLLLATLLPALSACKIIVVVPEGGEVQSRTGIHLCSAGSECTIEVAEGLGFSDSFIAVPHPGYVFAGWKQQDRYLCGGQQGSCALENVPASMTDQDIELFLEPVFEAVPDSDGDGVSDDIDVFPDNPGESSDSDGDGVGDNGDAFPDDAGETTDTDGDGVGDNGDAFPTDASETSDSDGDGVGDNGDAFPTDASEASDSDGDGVGDNGDAFPSNPGETSDTDGDGVGDNGDAFPTNPGETTDTDGDGVGDNGDAFPTNPGETTDTDGDGVGDNGDAFPTNPGETTDTDGDGVGDNGDAFPNDAGETMDTDGDGVGDNGDAFPNDASETVDTDGDGVGDNGDAFPNDAGETMDSDGDGVGDNADAFPNDPGETTDTDGDGVGDNSDALHLDFGDALRGESLFETQCASCHEIDGSGNNIFPSLLYECSGLDCDDTEVLATYIATDMPPGGDCSGQCAADVALYVAELRELAPAIDSSPAVPGSGSWNVAADACEADLYTSSQRLKPEQIQSTLHELFGILVDPLPGFPAPGSEQGFSTHIDANRISSGDIQTLADTADAAALALIDALPASSDCGATIDDHCAESTLNSLLPSLFRGTQSEQDMEDYLGLYNDLRSGDQALDADIALAGTLSAAIQSPNFLYLLEIGEADSRAGRRSLGEQEIANRIAYLLTGAPADAELLAAAERGELSASAGRIAEAERLLDAGQHLALTEFVAEWFGVADLDLGDRVNSNLAAAFREEFDRNVSQAISDDSDIRELFYSDEVHVNATLADYYGIGSDNLSGSGWQTASAPAERQAGLLSTALVAAAHSNPGGTSVIKRGHFVRTELLCYDLGSPPPGATSMNPVLDEDATVREHIEARSENAACEACHRNMDPIGIGMEDLDDLGLLRSDYAISGHPVDSNGVVAGLIHDEVLNSKQDVDFSGTSELGAALTNSPAVAMCAREKWFTFAMGNEDQSHCFAATLEAASNTTVSLRSLVLDLVGSDYFIYRSDTEN